MGEIKKDYGDEAVILTGDSLLAYKAMINGSVPILNVSILDRVDFKIKYEEGVDDNGIEYHREYNGFHYVPRHKIDSDKLISSKTLADAVDEFDKISKENEINIAALASKLEDCAVKHRELHSRFRDRYYSSIFLFFVSVVFLMLSLVF